MGLQSRSQPRARRLWQKDDIYLSDMAECNSCSTLQGQRSSEGSLHSVLQLSLRLEGVVSTIPSIATSLGRCSEGVGVQLLGPEVQQMWQHVPMPSDRLLDKV